MTRHRSRRRSKGKGLVNSLINKLPFELHIPGGYQYCGPGTKLKKRLARGDPGINPLDKACKQHDIAYSQTKDLAQRHQADRILAERAWERVKSDDAGLGEKAAAWGVTTTMKAKTKLGMGTKKKQKKMKKCKRSAFRGGVLTPVRKVLATKQGGTNLKEIVKIGLLAAKQAVKKLGGKRKVSVPRVIPLPKTGGILPFLIPLFAGLSAVGALTGGATQVVKAVNEAKAAKQQLDESQRHNKTMEAIALGRSGGRLYLKSHRTGSAIFLKPPHRSKN